MTGRTLVIGDIHGSFRALKQVLEKALIKDGDSLVFLGDYVDGWPESAQVVDYLLTLSKKHPCIFIRGNHDVWCGAWLARNEADQTWLENKGNITVESYKNMDRSRRAVHSGFFSSLKDYYIDNASRLFIHAGFTSLKGPAEETFPYNFNNDRTLLETALALDKDLNMDSVFYPKRLKLFNEIYIGHTPTTKYDITVPINAANLWDMDTGATNVGRISVMDVDTKELWQSDKVEDFYSTVNVK